MNKFCKTAIMAVIIATLCAASAISAEDNNDKPRKINIYLNSRAVILDMDGREETVTCCYDSDSDKDLILSLGAKGQSPVYLIDKSRIASIELDGITSNMSGWDFARATVTLKNGYKKSGFIQITHIGNDGYRTYEGLTSIGRYAISWKRLKRIDFVGKWRMVEKSAAHKMFYKDHQSNN